MKSPKNLLCVVTKDEPAVSIGRIVLRNISTIVASSFFCIFLEYNGNAEVCVYFCLSTTLNVN